MRISPGSGSSGNGPCAARARISRIMRAPSIGWTHWACSTRATAPARILPASRKRAPDWPRDPDGAPLYPGTCREKPHPPAREILASGGVALRLDMRKALAIAGQLSWREVGPGDDERRIGARPAQWGDVVLARKDTPASYHIAVVVDDALQGVTDIVRGRDLFDATSIHRLLQRLLDLPEPRYRHHELILDAAGEKLAKSRGAPRLRDLRAQGLSPAEIARRLTLAG